MVERYLFHIVQYVIFFLVVMTFSVYAVERRDFRNVAWGMTRFEVMASETDAPDQFDDPEIFYTPEINGRVHHLMYGFIEDKLVEAMYIISVRKGDDYHNFRKILEKKYGKPAQVLDKGNGNYLFFWSNDSTEVTMKPGRLKECRIEYISKKFKYLKERGQREKAEKAEKALMWAF